MADRDNESPREVVQVLRLATGGEGVAHLGDGRVVFVTDAAPGDRAEIEIIEQRRRFARGRVLEIIDPGPDRVEPACGHRRTGECGGCGWMHLRPGTQAEAKRFLVIDQLTRLGGLTEPVVSSHSGTPGRRTTVRCAVTDGRAGYRARRSDRSFAATSCAAAHPAIEQLIVEGRFGDAAEVTLRVGVGTGERLALIEGASVDLADVALPDDVVVVDAAAAGDARFYAEVGGRTWRISAQSFFQTSDRGAQHLVDAVRAAINGWNADDAEPIADLYAGVGLLGGAVVTARPGIAVESSPSAAADAAVNLPDHDVVHAKVEQWKPMRPWPLVIADPARRGLAAAGVATIERCEAERLVLVSCDPAALGRDTALLVAAGWRHLESVVINMFPDTPQVEVVTAFER